MTDDRSLGRAARSWLEQGPTRAPDNAVNAALARIQSIPQQRGLVPWRLPIMTVRVLGAASATIVVIVALIAIGLPRLSGAETGATPAPSSAPTPIPTATALPTPLPSAVGSGLAGTDQVHNSELFHYGMRYPSTWTLTVGTQPNIPDLLPALGLVRSDFYSDGVTSGVMVTAGPLSAARPDLATFSAFVAAHVPTDYRIYSGPDCTRLTRTFVLDGEPANEFDFYCPGHTALWLAAIHDGLAYQVAWLDDGPFTASDLQPKFDKFLESFTFAP